jgi:ATP:corrinoid adenosyltransferase
MELSKLASKPQLVKVVLDDEEVVEEFKESLEFYTWDRQPLETFMKLASAEQEDMASMFEVIKNLILDKDGKLILKDESMLPTKILMKAVNKITEQLGK